MNAIEEYFNDVKKYLDDYGGNQPASIVAAREELAAYEEVVEAARIVTNSMTDYGRIELNIAIAKLGKVTKNEI